MAVLHMARCTRWLDCGCRCLPLPRTSSGVQGHWLCLQYAIVVRCRLQDAGAPAWGAGSSCAVGSKCKASWRRLESVSFSTVFTECADVDITQGRQAARNRVSAMLCCTSRKLP